MARSNRSNAGQSLIKKQRRAVNARRLCRIEPLEDRHLLSVGDLAYTLLPASTAPQAGGLDGSAVAASALYRVSGSPSADIGGLQDSGVVNVYAAATNQLVTKLYNPTAAAQDHFGAAVAASGNYVVVGTPHDDQGAVDAGSVYIFDLSSATPATPITTLHNPGPNAYDQFGCAVAISGNYVVVGAYGDDAGANDSGAVYVYNLAGGTPTVPILTLTNPSAAAFDQFGKSVAVDGSYVVVGAAGDDTGAADAGSAYVYNIASGTPTTPVATLNNPAAFAYDEFGSSVAVSGRYVVVGARYDDAGSVDAGSAYVYDLLSGTPSTPHWTLANPTPAASEEFGSSVGVSGSYVVVGAFGEGTGANDAGAAYLYDLSSGTPTAPRATLVNPTPATYDAFGNAVAISGSGVVVGAANDDTAATDAGAAYVYDAAAATPSALVATLLTAAPTSETQFGFSVAAGTRYMVVAELGSQSAKVFDRTSATPAVPVATLAVPGNSMWFPVAVSGSYVVVGAPGDSTGGAESGSVYVYDMASATPAVPLLTLRNPSPGAGDHYGFAVAISGRYLVVGAYGDDGGGTDAGAAYVYDLGSATPGSVLATLANPTPAGGDFFGYSVAASEDRVVVGAYGDDTGAVDAGSAYVYNLSAGSATLAASLHNPAPTAYDFFGYAVAASGGYVVAGAYGDDTAATNSGSAYVYDVGSATPTAPIAALNNPTAAAGRQFGIAVAASGHHVIVGDNRAGASRPGAAYIYDLFGSVPTTPAATLNNPAPAAFDDFGYAVAAGPTYVVVGAPLDDGENYNQGAAYVYDLGVSAPAEIDLSTPFVAESAPNGTVVGAFSTSGGQPGETFSYSLVAGLGSTDNGSFVVDAAGTLTTAAALDYETKSSYSIRVRSVDGQANAVERVFVIAVTNVNENPSAPGVVTAAAGEDGAMFVVDLLAGATDPDTGDVLGVANLTLLSGDPAGVTIGGNSLTINPAAYNYLPVGGQAVIRYQYDVVDGNGGVTGRTAQITISGVNDAPHLWGTLYYASSEDAPPWSANLLAGDVDPDNDPLSVVNLSLSGYTAGMTVAGNAVLVDPSAYNFLAQDQHTWVTAVYDVVDGHGGGGGKTAYISLFGINDAPTVSAPLLYAANEPDAPFYADLLAGASDPDNATTLHVANVLAVDGDAAGISVSGNHLFVNPIAYKYLLAGQWTTVTYRYDVVDQLGAVVRQTAYVTIFGSGDNGAPQAVADTANVSLAGSVVVDILANDVNPSRPAGTPANTGLTLAALGAPSFGVVVINADRTVTYTPRADVDGPRTDSFAYTIADEVGAQATGTVTVNLGGGLTPDSITRSGSVIEIIGTDAADTYTLTNSGGVLFRNGRTTGVSLAGATELRVWALDGNDSVDASRLAIATFMHGGIGVDTLRGSSARNILFGDSGDDVLSGGAAADWLIGGSGADRLTANAGHDILYAGDLDFAASRLELETQLAAWVAEQASRPATDLLRSVVNDGWVDTLTGGAGNDRFHSAAADRATDLRS